MAERPVALVTGATRGIGRAVASQLGSTHHVLVGGRCDDSARQVAAGLPSAEPFVVDLTDGPALARAVDGLGRLDVVVHSAGVAIYGSVAETPAAEWRRLLEVNVVAVAELTRLLLPRLRDSAGLVVLMNSGSGLQASAGASAYGASKFALTAFADALRLEEGESIRVCSLHPGRTDTDMQRELQEALGRTYRPSEFMRPESVAHLVRTIVDLPPDAQVDSLRVRPTGR